MSLAQGTYWYGIFQGTGKSELYCPEFYLGEREKCTFGDMAYIVSTTFYYQGNAHQAYIALYSSSDQLTQMLKRNLTLDGSVSYIINERNAIVASSDKSGTGIYLLDYQTVEDSFMASNGFIERTILDQKIYAGFLQYPPARLVHGNCPALFFSFKTKQFYHVPVYPYVPCSAGACLSYGSFSGPVCKQPDLLCDPADEQGPSGISGSHGKPCLS